MNYDQIAHVVKLGGTVFFTGFFLLVLVYVFWPKNKEKFNKAASMPLDDTPLSAPLATPLATPRKESTL